MMTKRPCPKLYDLARGMLRPAYDRLAEAHLVKRDPHTDEISWPRTDMVQQLREQGLL